VCALAWDRPTDANVLAYGAKLWVLTSTHALLFDLQPRSRAEPEALRSVPRADGPTGGAGAPSGSPALAVPPPLFYPGVNASATPHAYGPPWRVNQTYERRLRTGRGATPL
jgi:hypothetical protein